MHFSSAYGMRGPADRHAPDYGTTAFITSFQNIVRRAPSVEPDLSLSRRTNTTDSSEQFFGDQAYGE